MNVSITGASSGIGAAAALELERQGMTVFAGVENDADGRASLAAAGTSPRLRRVVLDVTSSESMQTALMEIEAALGDAGLDAVVNNAGIGVPGPLETIPIDDLRKQLEVNVLGQVAVTQAALPRVRRASGRIVFVGSVGGVLASQFAGASTPIWDKAINYLDRLLTFDPPGLAPCRDRLHTFRESLHSADEHGKSPEDVAETIVTALTTERPDTRYVVGGAGKMATALRPLVPDRLDAPMFKGAVGWWRVGAQVGWFVRSASMVRCTTRARWRLRMRRASRRVLPRARARS